MYQIPEFPDLRPVSFEDKDFLTEKIWLFQTSLSELTFTNLFVWGNIYNFRWTIFENTVFILGGTESAPYMMQPVGYRPLYNSTLGFINALKEKNNINCSQMVRVDEPTANEFTDKPGILIEPQREHYDYVYRADHLIHLTGRHYHSKRNHLSHFFESYSFNYVSLDDPKILAMCLIFWKQWCQKHKCDTDSALFAEMRATREVLTNFNELELTGGAILIDNNIEAFAIGEHLNRSTAVIHFEKANPEINGLYAAINQMFCEQNFSSLEYINREQDLGNPHLRTAKESYHPDFLVKKFRVTFPV